MLEINDFDKSRPTDARTPDKSGSPQGGCGTARANCWARRWRPGASPNLPPQSPMMVPIETPLTFSGFNENVLREFGPLFQQMGVTAVQGGGGSIQLHQQARGRLAEFAETGRCRIRACWSTAT